MKLKPTEFECLEDLLHHVAHKAPSKKSFAQIAELMGKPYSTLASELNSGVETHKFGVSELLLLMELANSDDPVHFLAARRDGIFVKLPKAKNGRVNEQASIKAIKEFSEMMVAFSEAWQKDGLSEKTRSRILKEGYESVQAHLELLMLVEEMEVVDA